MNTLWKKLTILMLGFQISAYAVDQNPSGIVEMYPNEKPQYKTLLIYNDQSNIGFEEGEQFIFGEYTKNPRMQKSMGYVEKTFADKGFLVLPIGFYWDESALKIFGIPQNKDINKYVAVFIHYNEEILTPDLKISPHMPSLINGKWEREPIMEGSWKYIQKALAWMYREGSYIKLKNNEENKLFDEFQKKVKNMKLNSFFYRVDFVINGSGDCCLNILYDQEPERDDCEKFLRAYFMF